MKRAHNQRRVAGLFLLILFGFMLIAGYGVTHQQREHLEEEQYDRLRMEVDLIADFIMESFLKRDYGTIKDFLREWSQKREYVVALDARFKNGFLLVEYRHPAPPENIQWIKRRLSFQNNYLELKIGQDFTHIEAFIRKLNLSLLGVFAITTGILGAALWLVLQRVALVPLNHELDLARQENRRMGTELEITRRLQQMVLPRAHELSAIEHLDIAGFMEPATEVGGDYYDVLEHEGRVKIGIGDVTGHGLESGVLMLMVQMAVRTLLTNNVTNPEQFLTVLNRAVFENVQRMESDKNLTLALLDYHNGKVSMTGQHEEVLVVRDNGRVERVDTLDLGFMVGLEPDIAQFVAPFDLNLEPGDGLVLYTDGITEARNASRQFYGVERLCEIISLNWHKSANEILHAIVRDLQNHMRGRKPDDDVTLVILKQKAGAKIKDKVAA